MGVHVEKGVQIRHAQDFRGYERPYMSEMGAHTSNTTVEFDVCILFRPGMVCGRCHPHCLTHQAPAPFRIISEGNKCAEAMGSWWVGGQVPQIAVAGAMQALS